MCRFKLVAFVVATCIAACQGASMDAQGTGESKIARLGNTVRYYQTSWKHLAVGVDMEKVQNSATGIAGLGLTGSEKVAIVVHGRENSIHGDFARILQLSLVAADRNMVVILVDWSYMSFSPYAQAVALVPFIAQDLRNFITQLDAAYSNRHLIHLIGFDLGAHIVGIANRNSNIAIIITDPAGDRWDISSSRLRATDAATVEVIHTNRAEYGIGEPIGTLDVFPNGGSRQPGCRYFDHQCHHNRAYQYFAATVDMGGHLLARRCENMIEVNNNNCTGAGGEDSGLVVGTLALYKLERGIYRVNTGRIYPFSAVEMLSIE